MKLVTNFCGSLDNVRLPIDLYVVKDTIAVDRPDIDGSWVFDSSYKNLENLTD